MKYVITGGETVKIREESGVIQNISNSVIEISDNETFTDFFILYPLNQCSFEGQRYIRALGLASQIINVAPSFNVNLQEKNSRIIVIGLREDLTVNPETGLCNGIEIVEGKIKISAGLLNGGNVEIIGSGDFSNLPIELEEDIPKHENLDPEVFEIVAGIVHYKSGTSTAGYSVAGNKIEYHEATTSKNFCLSGLDEDKPAVTKTGEIVGLTITEDRVKIDSAALGGTELNLDFKSRDYEIEMAETALTDYNAAIFSYSEGDTKCTLTKSTKIEGTVDASIILGSSAQACTIIGGGNNRIYSNGKGNIFESANDTIYGFTTQDTLISEDFTGKVEGGVSLVGGGTFLDSSIDAIKILYQGQTRDETVKSLVTLTGSYTNSADNVIIYGSKRAIKNSGSKVIIAGGNNTITLEEKSNGTIRANGDTILSTENAGNHIYQIKGNTRIDGFKKNDTLQFYEELSPVTAKNFISATKYLTLGGGFLASVDCSNFFDSNFTSGGEIKAVDARGESLDLKMPKVFMGGGVGEEINVPSAGYYIYALGGNDTILNSQNNVTIDGGAGNEVILNSGENVSIYGNTGNDSIFTSSGNVTIWGGSGNDLITSTAKEKVVTYQFSSSQGTNTIEGYKKNDVLYFTTVTNISQFSQASINSDGSSISIVGASTSVTANSTDLIFDSKNGVKVMIKSGETAEILPYVRVLEEGSTYSNENLSQPELHNIAGLGMNTIRNYAAGVSINASSASPNLITSYADSCTLIAASGTDTIELVDVTKDTVIAGASNDVIRIIGSSTNNTIYGGAGDEYIVSNGNGNIFWYAGNAKEGSDTILGFGEDKDYFYIRNTGTVITDSTTAQGHPIITLTNGKYTTTITLEEYTGGGFKYQLGSNNPMQEYILGGGNS